MNPYIKLITMANSGGVFYGLYALIEGMIKPNPYHFPVAEFIVGPSLIVVCSIWIGLSFWISTEDNKIQKTEKVE